MVSRSAPRIHSPGRLLAAALFGLWSAGILSAGSPTHSGYEFNSEAQAALFAKLIGELRCLVCQNQTLADSNAELAEDLKRRTHALVMQGKSYRQITDYMVDRYGEFVIYRPRFSPANALLWFGPFLVPLGVAAVLISRRRTAKPDMASLADEELAQARNIIEQNNASADR